MKSCHPDLSGDDPDVTSFCMFINEIYEVCSSTFNSLFVKESVCVCFFFCLWSNMSREAQVLSDPIQRMVYDEIHGYSLTAINPFLDDTSPKDHAFVDEFSCIGMNDISPLLHFNGNVSFIFCFYLLIKLF